MRGCISRMGGCISCMGQHVSSPNNYVVIEGERERELRREGGKSLLAYVKGVDPHLKHIDR